MSPMWLNPRAFHVSGIAGCSRFVKWNASSVMKSPSWTEKIHPPSTRATPWRKRLSTTTSLTTCAEYDNGTVVVVAAAVDVVGALFFDAEEHDAAVTAAR